MMVILVVPSIGVWRSAANSPAVEANNLGTQLPASRFSELLILILVLVLVRTLRLILILTMKKDVNYEILMTIMTIIIGHSTYSF